MSFLWILVTIHVLWTWLTAVRRGLAAHKKTLPDLHPAGEPFISVLIPAWKEKTVLAETLTALQQNEYKHWEAIVIAGGGDGTEEQARALTAQWANFTVIPQPPKGKNAALRLGHAQAKGEIIVLLDADTVVTPAWLACLAGPLTHGYAAATANYSPSERTWVSMHFEMQKVSAYFVGDSTSLHGGGFAVRREVIDQIGGIPEDVTVGVDWDFDQRVNRLKVQKIFVPEARHVTHLSHTLPVYLRDEIRWRRAHIQNIFQRRQWPAFSFYISAVAFYCAPLFALSPFWQLWPLLWAWILLRRLGLGLEVTAFQRQWLPYLWVPAVLLPVDFLAGLIAFATIRRKLVFFKGSRPSQG